jgi:hypothetical protein
MPFDLTQGTWHTENATQTPGTVSHDGQLGILDDGTRWLAWSEPDAGNTVNQNIDVSRRDSSGNWMPQALTSGTNPSYAYASMRRLGPSLALVFSGFDATGTKNDVSFSQLSTVWGSPINITGGPMGDGRDDYFPSLAVSPSGKLAVAYVSSPPGAGSPIELRVVEFSVGGMVLNTFIDLLPGTSCDAPAAAFSGEVLHILSPCSGQLMHVDDGGTGNWTTATVPINGQNPLHPVLALGADGTTLHAVWSANPGNCAAGMSSCDDIYHATITGDVIGPVTSVTATGDFVEAWPTITVDASGRPIVAFHRFQDTFLDVYLTWSNDGGSSYSTPRAITPNTPMTDEGYPASLIIAPDSGLPEFVYQATIANSSPLNTELMRAYLTKQ